ncbi:RagB/SusD family nutrient uptake outer membrane protein [Flavobacterium sp. Fl-77]|uniref:RagB/SusD family nutrient uptake outer membrane protein n=1 Tax=Flavobacterium flavipigmentatum TaxID=2893884 RepID=A0AAJ2SEY1_9FLAO|nr:MULTISPECIES: RagB/SusD family nutrient uptake outer membrane protein [unclassified Flavobacterium]MDX6183462.1 RagB/SusD family nutrient uptake outer membrane protein [Flavobacterium sp. Fl-33]MDX6187136.1 RagB/SusD family nutrient uptake outer membrane protein [Flavobacterium sp. Fl-77]UFH40134.1 RagB/SusD family nutrient uptake outer membrane protein [Flavobacterium sp. F-70]
MKLISFKQSLVAFGVLLTLGSCDTDEKLEVKGDGVVLETDFYRNETEAYSGLVAAYDKVGKFAGSMETAPLLFLNSASDDFYAGGGNSGDQPGLQVASNYTVSPSNIPPAIWSNYYQGVFRCNVMIQKLPGVPMDAAKKARFMAEVKTLRAYYYFDIVRMFKNVPLILVPLSKAEVPNVLQAKPADVYAQIEKDLNEAIADLPITIPASESGRFSQGAAIALLGKVYLYDNKKAEAAAELAKVNGTPGQMSSYGYKLMPAFADLWNHANKFNTESIFEIAYSDKSNADWGNFETGNDEGNVAAQLMGMRDYARTATGVTAGLPDYINGWGFMVVTTDLANALSTDPRFASTIFDANAEKAAGRITFTDSYNETGYHFIKYAAVNADIKATNPFLNFAINTYIIRLADTYLLEAEALGGTGARAQALLDAVRARVGLPSVPVSLTAIYAERRLELAGEGHRWYDLVRTGQAASKLAFKGFTAGKNEAFPIPYSEFNNTKMVQNDQY